MNEAQQQVVGTTLDSVVLAVTSKTSWGGAITAVVGGLSLSGTGVLVGMCVGVASVLLQWYYKRKHLMLALADERRKDAADRRAQAEHERRMAEK